MFPLEAKEQNTYYVGLLANKRIATYEEEGDMAKAVRYAKKYYWNLYGMKDVEMCAKLADKENAKKENAKEGRGVIDTEGKDEVEDPRFDAWEGGKGVVMTLGGW